VDLSSDFSRVLIQWERVCCMLLSANDYTSRLQDTITVELAVKQFD